MRAKILIAMLTLAAVPVSAHAEHCDSKIYLFSYVSGPVADPLDPQRQQGSPTVTSSAIGCVVIGQDEPAIPGDQSDTDVIYPGSNTLVVRWLPGGPVDSATMTFAGKTYDLEFYRTTNGAVAVTDSKQILIDPADTLVGNTADITVCVETECDNRVYRTVA